MSYWRKKEVEFGEMVQLLQQRPGLTATQMAKELGVPASTILRRLPSMDAAGFLLSEDDQRRLWPFDPNA